MADKHAKGKTPCHLLGCGGDGQQSTSSQSQSTCSPKRKIKNGADHSDHSSAHSSTPSEGEFTCNDCDKRFVHQKSYKAHMLSHKGAFSCDICYKNFSNLANLNIHSRIHSGQKPFKCKSCSMCFRTSSMHKRHVNKEHPDKKALALPMYECPNCNRKLRSFASFQKHVARHDVQNLHVCELCQVDCFTHDAYLSHQKRCHSGEKGKTVLEKLQQNTCNVCKDSFYTISALWNHATLYHSPFVGLPCNVCGKLAPTRNAYMTHRRTHIEVKDYICHVCDKRFSKASHLQDHVRVHVQDYTYKCPVCDKGFLRPKNLTTHLLAKHRPTVDTCCLRTLQRRRKIHGDVHDASGNGPSISDNSGSISSCSSEASSVSSSCSPRFRRRIRPIREIEGFKIKEKITFQEQNSQTNDMDSNSKDSSYCSTDSLVSSSDSSGGSISDSASAESNSNDQNNNPINLDATFLQVSAFPNFDWKRVPTVFTDEAASRSPYVDVQGRPLFSKNKPAPMTKQLVDMAKSSNILKKTTATSNSVNRKSGSLHLSK